MKLRSMVVLFVMGFIVSISSAQETTLVPYITVSGYAEDWVEPDVAVWSIKLQDLGEKLKDLKRSNDQELERVLKIAAKLGVAEGHVISGRIQVSKKYKRDKHGNIEGFSHFVLTRSVKIEQYSMEMFDEFLDELLLGGELDVQLRYMSTTADSVKSELRLKAVRNAREKAVSMAEVLHTTVGQPIIVSEYPIITDYQQIDRLSMKAGVVIQATPERIHLRQKIYIRFALNSGQQPKDGP